MTQGRTTYTFKGTAAMRDAMQAIMERWNLDRTSVIKLALYLFAIHTASPRVRDMSVQELVEDLESTAPEGFPPYGEFGN